MDNQEDGRPGGLSSQATEPVPVSALRASIPGAYPAVISPGVIVNYIGGNCPVQAEGTIFCTPFYFRARGDEIRLDVGPEDTWHGDGCWSHEEEFGHWPDAGWINTDVALGFIVKAASLYIDELAQAIEARRAETGTGSAEDESAVPQGCATTPPPEES